jgi:hypothetical protein
MACESKISKAEVTVDGKMKEFQELFEDAHLLLLFLKSVERISFFQWLDHQREPELLYSGT